MKRICLVIVFSGFILSTPLSGEVLDSSDEGFSVRHRIEVQLSPTDSYSRMIDGVSDWWESSHTFSGDSKNLYIEAVPNGCFCETFTEGGGVRHAVVIMAQPGKRLRMMGSLGPLQPLGASGVLDFSLRPEGEGTAIELNYRLGGYAHDGLANWAGPVDGVLREQMSRLEKLLNTGSAE